MKTEKQAQHTPGPWHLGMKPGPIVYGPNGEQVADMRRGMLHRDEDVANIQLIAAAPELLASLKLALEEGKFLPSIKDAFERTIAKAEGRQ